MSQVCAGIDVGTISMRLLIDGDPPIRRAEVTDLGAGVDQRGSLDPDGAERTLEVLADYRTAMDAAGVSSARLVATAACRRAADGEAFLRRVHDITGIEPELLSGDEEARLSFAGATSGRPAEDGPFMVVDIGGGSIEIAVGSESAEQYISLPLGARTITDTYLEHDPPRPEELVAALSVLEAHYDDVLRDVPAVSEVTTLIGVAGTITTLAAVELGLAEYDRDAIDGLVLSRPVVEDLFRTLVTETSDERARNPGLPITRVESILGGVCAVTKLLRHFGPDEMVVCESDLLDALVADQIRRI